MEKIEVLGMAGAFILLIGFVANQLGKWKAEDPEYDLINLFAAIILAYYAYHIESLVFLFVFIIWFAFCTKDLIMDIINRKEISEKRLKKTKK
jgi:hypothetical protein